jgi:hypothetical protein
MTDTTTTITTDQLVSHLDRYIEAWNETDPTRRLALCEHAFTADAHYVDPFVDATGPAEISEFIGGMQAQFPDHRLERTSDVDAHHDLARFSWTGSAPDGTIAFAGIDVVIAADDGRVRALAGFVG